MDTCTKDKIIDTADTLFYQKGFERTSFADIATSVGIARGNLYHHFKAKNDLLEAVIERRISNTKKMLDNWHETESSAEGRIKCFINILIMNRAKITLYGCPVGTLTTELGKLSHPSLKEANKLFALFKQWLAVQFEILGKKPVEAKKLAMQLLARSQGSATVASAFHDEKFLFEEVEVLNQWLESLK